MESDGATPTRLDRRDALCLLGLSALLVLWILASFDFGVPPYEDAAILMRYAEHLGEGHGIVWNVGEEPVDGATDFFLVVSLGALVALGLSIEAATLGLSLVSHALTVLLVYAGVRRLHGTPRWLGLLLGGYLALGPGLRYAEAYFGTPYFALFATTSCLLAWEAFRFGASRRTSVLFALSSLLLGLTRPEGVFLALFLLASLVLARGWRAARGMVGGFVVFFGLPGAVYFAWRWQHFGHPLPNPYYIKGRDIRVVPRLKNGTLHVVRLALPLVPVYALALLTSLGGLLAGRRAEETEPPARETLFVLFPPAAFTALGVLHAGLMDYMYRFQYCLLPLLLVGLPPLAAGAGRALGLVGSGLVRRQALAWRALGLLVVLVVLGYPVQAFRPHHGRRWGTYELALRLADYPHEYTMAVTNAGHLPLYSGWRAVDAWGLNDHEIATEGLSAEMLERDPPELVQFDASFRPLVPAAEAVDTPWARANEVLRRWVADEGYVLAAAYGLSPYKAHHYYVRPDFAHSEEILRAVRETTYYMESSGAPCFDWALIAGRNGGEGGGQ